MAHAGWSRQTFWQPQKQSAGSGFVMSRIKLSMPSLGAMVRKLPVSWNPRRLQDLQALDDRPEIGDLAGIHRIDDHALDEILDDFDPGDAVVFAGHAEAVGDFPFGEGFGHADADFVIK